MRYISGYLVVDPDAQEFTGAHDSVLRNRIIWL